MISTHQVAGRHRCHDCGKFLDGATGPGIIPPQPGDLSVCAYCEAAAVFTDAGTLRPLTDDEQVECAKDIESARRFIRSVRGSQPGRDA